MVKPAGSWADPFLMNPFSSHLGWILLGVSAAGILAMLNTISKYLQHEARIHELRMRVNELRKAQLERLRKLAEDSGNGQHASAEPAIDPVAAAPTSQAA